MAPRSLPGSLAPQSVFQPANGVLHFALELISSAFAFELAVAGYLSDNFLHFALGLLSRALDAIFVHHNGLQYFERSRTIDGRNRYARRKLVVNIIQTPVVPENSIRPDSRGEAESAHHAMRCLPPSTCLQRS